MYLDIKYDTKAQKAWLDGSNFCFLLDNGLEIRFGIEKNKKLSKATTDELLDFELICDGTGIHWEKLNEDLSIDGILDGRFG